MDLRAIARQFVFGALPLALGLLMTDAFGSSATFTYDLAGRVGAILYDNGMCVAYTYDAAGNRTAQTNATAPSPAWGTGTWGCFSWTP